VALARRQLACTKRSSVALERLEVERVGLWLATERGFAFKTVEDGQTSRGRLIGSAQLTSVCMPEQELDGPEIAKAKHQFATTMISGGLRRGASHGLGLKRPAKSLTRSEQA
jgi:hypothetical protein